VAPAAQAADLLAAERPLTPQLGDQLSDVANRDRSHQTLAENRQQVLVEVVAVVLQGALATLAGFDPALIALRPPAGEPGEAKLRDRAGFEPTSAPPGIR